MKFHIFTRTKTKDYSDPQGFPEDGLDEALNAHRSWFLEHGIVSWVVVGRDRYWLWLRVRDPCRTDFVGRAIMATAVVEADDPNDADWLQGVFCLALSDQSYLESLLDALAQDAAKVDELGNPEPSGLRERLLFQSIKTQLNEAAKREPWLHSPQEQKEQAITLVDTPQHRKFVAQSMFFRCLEKSVVAIGSDRPPDRVIEKKDCHFLYLVPESCVVNLPTGRIPSARKYMNKAKVLTPINWPPKGGLQSHDNSPEQRADEMGAKMRNDSMESSRRSDEIGPSPMKASPKKSNWPMAFVFLVNVAFLLGVFYLLYSVHRLNSRLQEAYEVKEQLNAMSGDLKGVSGKLRQIESRVDSNQKALGYLKSEMEKANAQISLDLKGLEQQLSQKIDEVVRKFSRDIDQMNTALNGLAEKIDNGSILPDKPAANRDSSERAPDLEGRQDSPQNVLPPNAGGGER